MDYKEKLAENAEANFIGFKKDQLALTNTEIFDNACKINAYTELYGYLMGDHGLDGDVCKFLCESGEGILDVLYDEYISFEPYSLENWDEIASFVNDYRAVNDESYTDKDEPVM